MAQSRVLVVEHMAVYRSLLTEALADPEVIIVGTAASGRAALDLIGRSFPEIVVLDLDMQAMSGIDTLREMRRLYPELPVIVFAGLSTTGERAIREALEAGACDYAAKPDAAGGTQSGLSADLRAELLPKVRTHARSGLRVQDPTALSSVPTEVHSRSLEPGAFPSVLRQPRAGSPPVLPSEIVRPAVESRSDAPDYPTPPAAPVARPDVRPRVECVVVAVSTGGPSALHRIIPMLPVSLPVPMLVVQHIPPDFSAQLAQRLDQRSALTVAEATDGEPLEVGKVLIAPGGRHMVVGGKVSVPAVELNDAERENSCRPSADPLFRSVAPIFGGGVLAVVLTGMGCDGYAGCAVIQGTGGQVIAQDEATSVVWGMPGAVVRGGLADCQVPVDQVAYEITRRVAVGR